MVKGKKQGKASNKPNASSKPEISGGTSSDSAGSSLNATKLQQQVLDVFRDACVEHFENDFQTTLQEVKEHLFKRDFSEAFGRDSYLWAYAARYSASRALGYLQIFQDIATHLRDTPERTRKETLQRSEDEASRASGSGPSINRDDQVARPPHYVQNVIDDLAAGLEHNRIRGADDPPAYDAEAAVPEYEHAPAYPGNSTRKNLDEIENSNGLRIVSLGGGAGAELIASAAWLRLESEQGEDDFEDTRGKDQIEPNSLHLYCIDMADWGNIVSSLQHHIAIPPVLSKYASAAAQAANSALLSDGALLAEFMKQDVLDADLDPLRAVFRAADMVTIMFTLNELYSTSVSKTQRLLFELTVAMRPGTLLLVVDSPGSYSSVTINGAEKKYPMQWLLDHTLLETSRNTRILARGDHWEKLISDESRWFRLPKGLKYPIELENMRYQIHLYRRREV